MRPRCTGRKIHIWPGECHVHAGIRIEDLKEMKHSHPGAELVVHPECGCTTNLLYQGLNGGTTNGNGHIKFLSTGGMIKFAKESDREGVHYRDRNGDALQAQEG